MFETFPSDAPMHANPSSLPLRPPGQLRRRGRLLVTAVVGAALAAGGIGWWRHQAVTVTRGAATTLPPTEARLLAAASRDPKNPQPLTELGEEYAGTGRPASALWAYQEASVRAPRDANVRLKLATLLAQLGHTPTAEVVLRSLLAGAAAATAEKELAEVLLATGRPAAAPGILKAAGADTDLTRGRVAQALGDTAGARRFYQAAATAGDAEAYQRLAHLELAAGDLKAAQEAMRARAYIKAAEPEDLILVAAIRAAAGTPAEIDKALERLMRCIKQRPQNAEARYQAGLLLMKKGMRLPAGVHLVRATQLDPGHADAHRKLAELLQAMGQSDKAHRQWAAFYQVVGQSDQALAELRRIPPANTPADRERTMLLVRLLGDTQQTAAAVKEAQAGLRRHPDDPELMLQLGRLYEAGEWDAPLQQLCQSWMARKPESGVPHWLLGRRAVRATHRDEAIREFQAACTKEPSRSEYALALGLAYLMTPTAANAAEARPWLEKAVALDGKAADAHEHLGRALELTGDLEGARRQFLAALDLQPRQTRVLNHMAQVSSRLNRPEAAGMFAELARIEGERGEERKRLVRSIQEQPNAPQPHLALARYLIRNGQLTSARGHLQRATAHPEARQVLGQVERLLSTQAG